MSDATVTNATAMKRFVRMQIAGLGRVGKRL